MSDFSVISELREEVEAPTIGDVRVFENLSAALALLRKRRGLKLSEVGARQGVSESTASRVETNAETLRVATLDRHLAALGATFADLGDALAEVNGTPAELAGKPRGRWVSGLTLRPRYDVDTLVGFLIGALDPDDPRAALDFVASVEVAARGLALEALRQATATARVISHPTRFAGGEAEEDAARGIYRRDESSASWEVNELRDRDSKPK